MIGRNLFGPARAARTRRRRTLWSGVAIAGAAALALLAPVQAVWAGNTDSALSNDAAATVVKGIKVTRINDMRFGTMLPTGNAGTVELTINSTRTVSPAGNVHLVNGLVAPQAANFNVTGEPDQFFNIALPPSIVISSGGNDMDVDLFVSQPPEGGGASSKLSPGGFLSFIVGATLHVGANQAVGTYTGTFDVSVTYE